MTDTVGSGEILTRGRNVCMGYLWDAEKTDRLIDSEGWVHSGDLGRIDQDGFIFVTGRIKVSKGKVIVLSHCPLQELIITSGGENIAPVPIENEIESELGEIVSQAMVIGDNRKHLSVILTLKTELIDNQPSNILHPDVVKLLKKHNFSAENVEDVLLEKNPILDKIIQEGLKRANSKAPSRAQKVHKYLLYGKDFSIETGELTPTMKLKRHFILKKYKDDIEKLYG